MVADMRAEYGYVDEIKSAPIAVERSSCDRNQSSNVCVKCRNGLKESITLKDCDHQFCLACFDMFCRHLDRYSCDVCKKPNNCNQFHSKTSDLLPSSNMTSTNSKQANKSTAAYRKNGFVKPHGSNQGTSTITTVEGKIQNMSVSNGAMNGLPKTSSSTKQLPQKQYGFKVFQNTCPSQTSSAMALIPQSFESRVANKSCTVTTSRKTVKGRGASASTVVPKTVNSSRRVSQTTKTDQLTSNIDGYLNPKFYFKPIEKCPLPRRLPPLIKVTPIFNLVDNIDIPQIKVTRGGLRQSANSAFVKYYVDVNRNVNVIRNHVQEFCGFSDNEQATVRIRAKRRQSAECLESLLGQPMSSPPPLIPLSRPKAAFTDKSSLTTLAKKRRIRSRSPKKGRPTVDVQHHYFLRPKKRSSYT